MFLKKTISNIKNLFDIRYCHKCGTKMIYQDNIIISMKGRPSYYCPNCGSILVRMQK